MDRELTKQNARIWYNSLINKAHFIDHDFNDAGLPEYYVNDEDVAIAFLHYCGKDSIDQWYDTSYRVLDSVMSSMYALARKMTMDAAKQNKK